MDKLTNLIKSIDAAQMAYYNGASIIDDDEYDALVYELSNLDPTNDLLVKIGAEPVDGWKKDKHLIALGSLNKVNSPEEINDWITNSLNNEPVLVVEKLDGLSVGCQYKDGKLIKACLRGNGLEGEDIFTNVIKMKGCVRNIPEFTGTVRGEIVLTKLDHKAYFPDYSNPRNAASGLCRRLDGSGCEHLTLMFYQVVGDQEFQTEFDVFNFLKKHQFITPNYKLCKSADEVSDMWSAYQSEIRSLLEYEIDGLVVNCNNLKLQKSFGETNNRSKGKIAFKFANQFVKTIVKKIEWMPGTMGRITPVCWIDPVSLLGSTVEKASVYNMDYIKTLGLDVGADVLVCKAGEIIPRIEKVVKSTGTIASAPTHCPSCGSLLKMQGEYIICPNTNVCPAQVEGRLHNWIKELNILEWGQALISKLVELKLVNTVADLYKLSVDDLAKIDRMGKKSATNCYNSLWSHNPVPLELFIGGLSIPLIGSSTIKLLMDEGYNTLDKILALSEEQICDVKGLGPARSSSLHNGLKRNKEVIGDLMKSGIKIQEQVVGGKLYGLSFAFTGAAAHKRDDLEAMVEKHGGTVKGVGKTLTYLVIADPSSTSSKAVKARTYGCKLISESELFVMCGEQE